MFYLICFYCICILESKFCIVHIIRCTNGFVRGVRCGFLTGKIDGVIEKRVVVVGGGYRCVGEGWWEGPWTDGQMVWGKV